jgi:serine/threonine-protein kinase
LERILGNYKIVRLLGAGGMGEVYLARHTHIARQAAIKLLLPQVSRDPEVVERFFNEARATSLIQHDGIIEILDCGNFEDRAYIIMEYLEGESLGARLARERSLIGDLGALSFIGRQVAQALGAAHARGIIHRDLKPDNIYLAKSAKPEVPVRIKILDFGIAKLTGADKEVGVSHTRAGLVMGTPLYMAPEQCRGAAVDHRTDIYALGCMLYEMATGRPPFVAETSGDLLIAHATLIPPRASELEPRVPPALDELIVQLLAKDPAQRPASMADVATLLEAVKGGERPSIPTQAGTMILPSEGGPLSPNTTGARASTTPPVARPTGAVSVGGTAILETPQTPSGRHGQAKSASQSRQEEPGRASPRPGRSLWLALAMGVVVLGGGAAAYLLTRDSHRGPERTDAQGAGDGAGDARRAGEAMQAPPGMVALAGRTFTMGSSPEQVEAALALCKSVSRDCRRDIFEREQPARTVVVAPFALDVNEVTNAELADWLERSGATSADGRNVRDAQGRLLVDLHPLHGGVERKSGRFQARSGREKLPAVQVTWWGASAYCLAQGKRLPTEAEWERAARGAASSDEPLSFPWGTSKPTCEGVTFGGGAKGVCPSLTGPRLVGTATADVTAEGLCDLGGNVGEWVRDDFVTPYQPCANGTCENPVVEPEADAPRVIRGGDWVQAADACRSAGRSRRQPDKAEINVGFRCAK